MAINKKMLFLVFIYMTISCSHLQSASHQVTSSQSTIKNIGFSVLGTGSLVMIAATLYGLKDDCKKFIYACLSPEKDKFAYIPSDTDATLMQRVSLKDQTKELALRSSLLLISIGFAYYCATSIFCSK